MKKIKKQKIMFTVAIASSVILLGFFPQSRAGEHAPKDAYIGGSVILLSYRDRN